MTEPTQPTGDEQSHSGQNRYILIAVLAFAALMGIYIVKTNLEPPKTEQVEATQAANSRIPMEGDTTTMPSHDELLHQADHIRDVLSKDSSNYGAWVALGNIYFDADMPGEAVTHYRRALAIKPGDLSVMTDLATMERATGHPDSAVAILQRVVAADSTLAQAWFNLGVINNFDLKNTREAIIAWKKFLSISPPSEHTEAIKKEIERMEKELGS
jgi:cytochrome c-type biogenesis protein CcmH/NrfG